MKRWLTVLSMAAIAGCASSGASTTTTSQPVGPVEGTYDYTAPLPGQQVTGQLRVLGDTIIVMPTNDYCQPVLGPPMPLVIRYTCNGPGRYESMTLTLDRRNPVQFSKWAASFRVQKQRQVCVRYEMRSGQQVCAQTGYEPYEDVESRSGTLQVRRASP
jgi:hypothetical protein